MNNQSSMDSLRFLIPAVAVDILRRWADILLAALIAVMCTFIYLTVSWEPLYSITASYSIMTKATTGYETYSTGSVSYTVATTFEYLIESEILQAEVADALGQDSLNGTITSDIREDTNIMDLTVTAGSPQEAYEIITAVIDNYQDLVDVVMGSITLDVYEQPVIPVSPYNKPDRSAYMAIAAAAAAIAVAVLLGIISGLRGTIKCEADFRQKLSVRRLSTIPYERHRLRNGIKKRKDRHLLITRFPISYRFTEGIERLRSNFEYRAEKKGCKVVLVTSTLANEGKSTISVNLALSLAKAGKKVVFVDGDLRNPTTHKMLGVDRLIKADLGDFLQGGSDISDVLMQYGKTRLYLMIGRKRYDNASELLGSPRMSAMIQAMRKFADYIIIDTPPAGAMIDTEEVSGYADGAVLVVRQNAAPARAVRDVLDSLGQTGIQVLGCVFNNVYMI